MRTIKIKNGDFYEDFTYYDCEKCGKEIPESHGYSEENGFKFCHECSFIKGLINEETYLSIHGIHLNSFHAAIIPGTEKIYVWYSKSKVAPWDLEKSGADIPVLALTATAYADAEAYKHEIQAPFEFATSDETALKTVIRSNPGVVWLKKGVVYKKWHFNDVPSAEELNAMR